MGYVVTVSGAVGGIGASTFAFALALQPAGPRVLVDAQPDGVPLDVLLGAEAVPGARWSGVRLTSPDISVDTVLEALPSVHGVHLLSSDRDAVADAGATTLLVAALRTDCDLVVIDTPLRAPVVDTLQPDLRILLMPPTVAGLGAALLTSSADLGIVAVDIGNPSLPIGRLHEYLEHPVVGSVRWQRAVTAAAEAGVAPPPASDVMRLAALLWEGLAHAA